MSRLVAGVLTGVVGTWCVLAYQRRRSASKSRGEDRVAALAPKHYAGRFALGKNEPVLISKDGFALCRTDGPVRLLGGACGECLGGKNLARLLRRGYELEMRAMIALESGKPAEALSIHTSAGTPPELDGFIEALWPHVATLAAEDDWCVNLQAEGASAVHAAIDMCLQVFSSSSRKKLACGASSYHGPGSTSPGGESPLGTESKGLTHPVRYPVPTPMYRKIGESDSTFHERLLFEFGAYLDAHSHEIGVLLIEPQWGSSVAALPWPPALLRAYITAAKARSIAVVCDEVMCGLGRHGAEPAVGGTGCFLSECWGLAPDALVFGKAIGGGAGHLLSGAILLHGASHLRAGAHGTALQSHTYAGASSRALLNGTELLKQLPSWRPHIRAVSGAIAPVMQELTAKSGGAIIAHGQGCMWGGMFAHHSEKERIAATRDLQHRCAAQGLKPYFSLPLGGFMLTPRYDDEPQKFGSAVQELASCALETVAKMGWEPSSLMPSL